MYKYKKAKNGMIYYLKDGKRIARNKVPYEHLHNSHKTNRKIEELNVYNNEIKNNTNEKFSLDISKLPLDTINEINKFLYFPDFLNLRSTCKKFRDIYNKSTVKNVIVENYKKVLLKYEKKVSVIKLKNIFKSKEWTDFKKKIETKDKQSCLSCIEKSLFSIEFIIYEKKYLEKYKKYTCKKSKLYKINITRTPNIYKEIKRVLMHYDPFYFAKCYLIDSENNVKKETVNRILKIVKINNV